VYHHEWLTKKDNNGNNMIIGANHPIFLSRVFTTGQVYMLSDKVIGDVTSGRCEHTNMTATGIPLQKLK
jgi:hypothetical protein